MAEGQERRVEALRAAASAGSLFSASALRCGHRPVLRTQGLKGHGGKGNAMVFLFGDGLKRWHRGPPSSRRRDAGGEQGLRRVRFPYPLSSPFLGSTIPRVPGQAYPS